MAYRYNIYGADEVDNAVNNYNSVSAAAPVYADSAGTQAARRSADAAAADYNKTVNGGYRSAYSSGVSDLVRKYNQNDNFSWSTEGSAEYQNMRNKARLEGEKQLEDVQGSYAANTGGYMNSYAQAAGQRAYNRRMEELTEKIPSLRASALSDWSAQQERTMNQIAMMQNLDDAQYQRYRDSVADKYDFMNYYQQKYQTERGLDMSAFQNELAKWQSRLGAAASELSSIRQLAESQYEHNNLSADTQASIESQRRQNNAYYDYLYSKLK